MSTSLRNEQMELWPQIVDRLSRERPGTAYGLWPLTSDSYDAGVRTITYGQLANIINGLAWWLVKQIGQGCQQDSPNVLTYVGPNDVRLTAMIIASVKAGYTLFLTSPRNSPAAQQSLFRALKCKTLVTTDMGLPTVLSILDIVEPRCLVVPSLDELVSKPSPLFAYDKTFQEGRWDPLFAIHTSGSTGIPKPLVFTQESFVRSYALACQEVPSQQQGVTSVENLLAGKRVMITMPSFHGAGIMLYLFWAVRIGCTAIAPAGAGIVTAHGLADALKHTSASVAVLVPSVVAELAQNLDALAYCARHLELILYCGGDLPQALGDIVAAQIPLRSWWGASEVGIPHQLIAPGLGPGDWRYIRFHPKLGAVFDPVADGMYELVIRRDDELYQSSFSIQGQEGLSEYRTRDLFQPHPTVPDAWAWRSRADDIIVLLNGEKTNPVSMEQHIVAQSREVSGALVVGTQRFQTALLIEPAALSETGPLSTSEQAALIERVWPAVREANEAAPAHARVEKSLILVVDRTLIRAGKGTIQRAASVQQYSDEIAALYAHADIVVDEEDNLGEAYWSSTDASSVTRLVRESVCAVTGWQASNQAENSTGTFFDHGMDSLMALQLIRRLRRGLHRPDLALSTIYLNPTVTQLNAAITSQSLEAKDSDALLMEPMLSTYRALIQEIPVPIPKSPAPGKESKNEPVAVILTGSTGTIGTYLLRALLDRPGIGHVFCLNRSEDGGEAVQKTRMAERGLDLTDLDQRATFLQADLSRPHLGLKDKTYRELCARTRLIIHNAWPVNFNLGLAAFRPQLAGLVNLFQLTTAVTNLSHTVSFVFVSSVSAVGIGGPSVGYSPVPESVLTLEDAPMSNGYARSKFLSEVLCDVAARRLGFPVTIIRIGQVGGAVRLSNGGEWNRNEWLPSLVLGSLFMGCLPDNLGSQFSEIDWLPADLLADVLVDLVQGQQAGFGSEDPGRAQVYNLRNPHTTTWDLLLPSIIDTARACLGPDRVMEVVPPSTWLKRLDDAASQKVEDGTTTVANPAIRLLEFYRDHVWAMSGQQEGVRQDTPPMAIERSLTQSTALQEMQAVGPAWMQKWVREWIE